ncbi:Dihydroorotate dehydrogenase (quinone), mitochondrial [Chytridiales sp. JEL 0842]|nr:Dihydroorotate dehydrogenase (quinone), mitochondrial [Chytridiales sp. JEL 0842]
MFLSNLRNPNPRSLLPLPLLSKPHPPFRPLTSTSTPTPRSPFSTLHSASLLALTATFGTLSYFYLTDTRAGVYKHVAMPLLHAFVDPEDSHKLSIWAASKGLVPWEKRDPDVGVVKVLETEVWGKKFSNPLGLAAGYDKHGEAIDALLDFGFGFVEIGSVTPEPQPGNPRPRMFRLKPAGAVINRYGFNSEGHSTVSNRLKARLRSFLHSQPQQTPPPSPDSDDSASSSHPKALTLPPDTPNSLRPGKLLGINLGKNKTSPADSNDDYVKGIHTFGPLADYLVVNISSPNTPGLRSLQRREPMLRLLKEVKTARDEVCGRSVPVLVKVAPDLKAEEVEDVAAVVTESGIDGIIIGNTTTSRPSSLTGDSKVISETGGLSGTPLLPITTPLVSQFYKLTNGRIPIIACGGISSAEHAIAYAKAGASLVQVYTGLGYTGPGLVAEIKEGLVRGLGGRKWVDLVGEDHRRKK